MKKVFTIINRNFVFRDRAEMPCHYCGSPFTVVRRRVNLVLFACDECKAESKKVNLTELNENSF